MKIMWILFLHLINLKFVLWTTLLLSLLLPQHNHQCVPNWQLTNDSKSAFRNEILEICVRWKSARRRKKIESAVCNWCQKVANTQSIHTLPEYPKWHFTKEFFLLASFHSPLNPTNVCARWIKALPLIFPSSHVLSL